MYLKKYLRIYLSTIWVLMGWVLKYILKMYVVLGTQVHFGKVLST